MSSSLTNEMIDEVQIDGYDLFVGRVLPFSCRDDYTTEKLKNWLEDCQHYHNTCRQLEVQLPTHLIDVGDPEKGISPRIVDTRYQGQLLGGYVFLSFNWGGNHLPMLTKDKIGAYLKSLPTEKLPQLHNEALSVCRRLGYQYLWIDAYCIVHDDHDEMRREVARLSSYVSQADVVFVATARDSYGSLFANSGVGEDESISLQVHMENNPEVVFQLTLRQPIQTAASALGQEVLNRGWRIQEVYLARRLVVFGRNQIHWNCGVVLRSESSIVHLPPAIQGMSSLSMSLKLRHSFGAVESPKFIYESWYRLVDMQSHAKLTFEPDRLASMASLIQSFHDFEELEHDICVEGHWKNDFAHSLLWINDKHAESQHDSPTWKRGPKWSWPSNWGPISYAFAAGLKAAEDLKMSTEFFIADWKLADDNTPSLIMKRVVSLTVSALCRPLYDPTCAEEIQCFLDDALYSVYKPEKIDRCLLMIVAPWVCKPTNTSSSCRWVGLILREISEAGLYARQGVFVGPNTTANLGNWIKQKLRLE
jgi:hypothetical protein